ncbi:hypothetical protein B0H13DRAFT_1914796 [Mycena leptocephala]|nr:hypothetical protein B0H13DRAFT_1914796 [Mycena leptocephala]
MRFSPLLAALVLCLVNFQLAASRRATLSAMSDASLTPFSSAVLPIDARVEKRVDVPFYNPGPGGGLKKRVDVPFYNPGPGGGLKKRVDVPFYNPGPGGGLKKRVDVPFYNPGPGGGLKKRVDVPFYNPGPGGGLKKRVDPTAEESQIDEGVEKRRPSILPSRSGQVPQR